MRQKESFDYRELLPKPKTTFEASFHCFNCGHDALLTLQRGQIVREQPCPNCRVSPKRLQDKEEL